MRILPLIRWPSRTFCKVIIEFVKAPTMDDAKRCEEIDPRNSMPLTVKDTLRATVKLTYDGRVIKIYHGPKAHARFKNEVEILRFLEARGCGFVPRLIEADEKELRIVTTSCGSRVEHLDQERT